MSQMRTTSKVMYDGFNLNHHSMDSKMIYTTYLSSAGKVSRKSRSTGSRSTSDYSIIMSASESTIDVEFECYNKMISLKVMNVWLHALYGY